MCGGCPGGAAISRISSYAAVTGIKSGVGSLLQKIAGRRLTIRPFGDQWTLQTRLGQQSVVPGLEEVAAAVATDPLAWSDVAALTGEKIGGEAPHLTCASAAVLQRINGSPLQNGQERELSAGQFTAALLVQAANHADRQHR